MYEYESFINYDEEVITKGDPNAEGYQGPPYYPEIDEIIDNSDEERPSKSYDQYIGADIVLPDCNDKKIMGKVRKRVRYDDTSTGEENYTPMNHKSLYEVECTDRPTAQLEDNIISENMLSQVNSEGNHYQVLTEVTYHKKDNSAISKVYGFIKSSSGKTTP